VVAAFEAEHPTSHPVAALQAAPRAAAAVSVSGRASRFDADADAPPDEQLWHGPLAFFTFVAEQRGSWSVLLRRGTGRDGPFAAEATRLRGQLARLVAQLLGEAAAADGLEPARVGATDPLAHALVGAAESLAGWWFDHPDEPTERVALWLMNFAWTGFGDLVRGEAWVPPASG